MDVLEYKVKISGDTGNLDRALMAANGKLQKLSDDEILVKLNYDGNYKQFYSIIQKIYKEAPEIGVKFQYDMNLAALQKEKAKLDKMMALSSEEKVHEQLVTKWNSFLANTKGKGLSMSGDSFKEARKELSSLVKTLMEFNPTAFDQLGKAGEVIAGFAEFDASKAFKVSEKDLRLQTALVGEIEENVNKLKASFSDKVFTEDKTVKVRLDTTEFDAKAAEIKQFLEDLPKEKKIKIGIDVVGAGGKDELAQLAKDIREATEIKGDFFNERALVGSSKTGYISNKFVTDERTSVSGMVNNAVIASAKEAIDTFIHTHPEKYAAFSRQDISTAFHRLLYDKITKQIVMATEEIMELDMSKVNPDMENELADELEQNYQTVQSTYKRKAIEDVRKTPEILDKFIVDYIEKNYSSDSIKNDMLASMKNAKQDAASKLGTRGTVKSITEGYFQVMLNALEDVDPYISASSFSSFMADEVNQFIADRFQLGLQELMVKTFGDKKYWNEGVTSTPISVTPVDQFHFGDGSIDFVGTVRSAVENAAPIVVPLTIDGEKLRKQIEDAIGDGPIHVTINNIGTGDESGVIDTSEIARRISEGMSDVGIQGANGYIDAFRDPGKIAELEAAITAFVEAGIEAAKTAQDSHSPSRRYHALATDAILGYDNGLVEGQEQIADTVRETFGAPIDAQKDALSKIIQGWSSEVKSSGKYTNEKYTVGNSKTGYAVAGNFEADANGVATRLFNEIINSAIEPIDTWIHSHPESVAAFSDSDIQNAFKAVNAGITKQIVAAADQVMALDLSKVDMSKQGEIQKELSTEFDRWDRQICMQIAEDLQSNLMDISSDFVSSNASGDEASKILKNLKIGYKKLLSSWGEKLPTDINAMLTSIEDVMQNAIKRPFGENADRIKNFNFGFDTVLEEYISKYDNKRQSHYQRQLLETFSNPKYLKNGATSAISVSAIDDFKFLGNDAFKGYSKGIKEGSDDVSKAAEEMTEAGIEAVKSTQDSHSPSQVYYGMGQDAMDGYIQGVKSKQPEVEKAVSDVVTAGFAAGQAVASQQQPIGIPVAPVNAGSTGSSGGSGNASTASGSTGGPKKTYKRSGITKKTVFDAIRQLDDRIINGDEYLSSRNQSLFSGLLGRALSTKDGDSDGLKSILADVKKLNNILNKAPKESAVTDVLDKIAAYKNASGNQRFADDLDAIALGLRDSIESSRDLAEALGLIEDAKINNLADYRELEEIFDDLPSMAKTLQNYLDSGNFTSTGQARISDLRQEIIGLMSMDDVDLVSDDTFGRLDDVRQKFSALKQEMKEIKLGNATKLQKNMQDIAKVLADNSNMSSEMRARFEALSSEMEEMAKSGDFSTASVTELTNRLIALKTEMITTGQTGKSAFDIIGHRLTDMNAKFIAQYLSIQDWIRYIRQAAKTVIELDTALTELRKVSDASTTRLQQSFRASAETAKELGATISDVINVTADWSRLGETIDDAEKLARVTTLFKNVGDNISAEDASSYMISAMKGFHYAAEDAEHIVDVYNEVANNYAIDTAGIGEAIKRSAASFKAANTTIEEAVAIVTTANSVAQDPASVGTAMKTMSARIRASKAELKELGEAEDGVVESTANLQKYIKGITGFDILEKDQKTFKSLYEILLGIGKEFDRLDDVTKAALAEKLFGKRMGNIGLAILNDPEQMEKVYATATNAVGSAQHEQENYMRSVQYSIDQLKASAQELANDVLNSQFLKGGIEALTKLVNILDELIKRFGVLGPLVGGIGIASSAKAIGVSDIVRTIGTASPSVSQFFAGGTSVAGKHLRGGEEISAGVYALVTGNARVAESAEDFAKATEILQKGTKVSEKSITSANAAARMFTATLWSLGAAVAAVAVYKFANSGNEIRQAASDAAQACENASDQIDDYQTRITKLRAVMSDSSSSYEEVYDAQQELYGIQREMIDQYEKYGVKVDVFGDSIESLAGKFDLLKQKQYEAEIEAFNDEAGVNPVSKFFHGLYRDFYGIGDGKKGRPENTDIIRDKYERTNQGRLVYDYADVDSMSKEYVDALKKINGITVDVENSSIYATGTLQEMYDAFAAVKDLAYEYDDREGFIKYLDNQLKDLNADLNGEDRLLYDKIVFTQDIAGNKTAAKIYDEITKAKKAYDEAMISGDEEDINAAIENYSKAIHPFWTNQVSSAAREYMENMFPEMQAILDAHEFKAKVTVDPQSVANRAEIIDALRGYDTAEAAMAADDPVLQQIADKYKIPVSDLIDWSASEGLIPYDAEVKFDEAMNRLADTPAFGQLLNESKKWDVGFKKAVIDVVKNSKTAEEALKKISEINLTKANGSVIDSFANMTSGMDQISDVLADLQDDNGKFDFTKIGNSKFDKTFEGMTEQVEAFQQAVLSSKGVMTDEVQAAANGLADAYIRASLAGQDLATADQDVIASMLETMNVTNAEEYAAQLCAEAKMELAYANIEESASSYESEVAALANLAALDEEGGAANDDANAFRNLMYEKLNSAITVGSSAQIAELAAEAEAVGILASSWRDLAAAKAFSENIESMGGSAKWKANAVAANNARIASLQENNLSQLNALKGKSSAVAPNIARTGGGSGGGGGGGGGGSDKDKKNEEKEIDWMERMVTLLQKQHDILKENADDEYQTYQTRIDATKELIKQDENLLNVYKQQSREYGVAYEKAYDEVRKLAENGQLKDLWDNDIYGLGASYEEIKKVNDEINATFEKYGKRNLDYNNRPYIKGDDGSWVTMLTETAGFKVGENEFSVVITPILEDGTEINLDEYLAKIQDQLDQKAANGEEINLDTIVSLDPNDLIVAAANGSTESNAAAFEQMETELQVLKDKAIELREANVEGVKSLRDAVENGALDISMFSQEIQEAIQKLFDYYDKVQTSRENEKKTLKQIKDEEQSMYEMELNMIKERQKAIEQEQDIIQHSIEMRETTGRDIIRETDYEDLIDNADRLADNYREQLSVLQEQKGTLQEGSAAWYNVVSQIYEVDSALRDVEKQQAEWNEQIKQLPIRRIQRYLQMLENIKKDIQNYNAEMSTLGENANQQSYTDMFDIDVKALDKYKEELDKLRENLKTYKYGTDKFEETANAIQECEDSVSSLIQEMREFNTEILNIPIQKINQLIEKLNSIKDAMEEVQEDNNTVTETAIAILEHQANELNKQIEEVNKKYDERRKIYEEERDANKEQLELEKARFALEKARGQKTNKVLKNGEWTWQADPEALRDATENLKNAEIDKHLADIDKEEQAELKPLEEALEFNSKQLEKWSEHRSDSELGLQIGKAIELTGEKDFENQVLTGNDEAVFSRIQKSYNEMLHSIDKYTEQIKDYEQTSALMSTYISEYNKAIAEAEQIEDPTKRQKAMKDAADYYMKQMTAVQNQAKNGFTSQENLQSTLGAYKETSIESALANTIPAVQGLYSDFSSYMKIVSDQTVTLDKYTETWNGIHQSVLDQLEELKRLKEQEDEALRLRRERNARADSDSDRDEKFQQNVWKVVGGGLVEALEGSEHVGGNYYEKSYSSYDEMMRDVGHHGGIKTGYIGRMSSDEKLRALDEIASAPLKKDDIPALLQEGEVVLTPKQQSNLLSHLVPLDSSDMLSQFTLGPDALNLSSLRSKKLKGGNYAGNGIQMNQNFNFGDIHVMEAQNVTDIARGIMNGGLSQALTQQLYKR